LLLEQRLQTQDSLARLIALTRRRLKQAVGAQSSAYGLSPQQFWTLVFLGTASGASLTALCERMRIDAPTASRIVAALVRQGLVRAARDARDRRLSRLTLSVKGRRLYEAIAPIAREIRTAVESDLSAQEKRQLRRLLHKVIDSLDRYHPEGAVA
jgi:DNA-binding MarR family transcriptional regulator